MRRPQVGWILVATGACLPAGEPNWLVDDTRVIAVEVRVREVGELAPERATAVALGDSAEAMPGDTVRLEALVVDADGIPFVPSGMRWVLCPGSRCERPALDVPKVPCKDDLRAVPELCWFGEGPVPQARLPVRDPSLLWERRAYGLTAVMPSPGGSAEDCLTRLAARNGTLWDCRFYRAAVRLGPDFAMAVYAYEAGLFTGALPQDFPAEFRAQPPNRAPALDHLELLHEDGRVDPVAIGGIAHVQVGERALLRVPDSVEPEQFFTLSEGQPGQAPPLVFENLIAEFFTPVELPGFVALPLAVRFDVPDVPTIRFAMSVADNREAVSWSEVELVVDGASQR